MEPVYRGSGCEFVQLLHCQGDRNPISLYFFYSVQKLLQKCIYE